MPKTLQLFVALTAEAKSDWDFLTGIIERTIEVIALEHDLAIDVFFLDWPGSYLKKGATSRIIRKVHEYGAQLLFVHHDLDEKSREDVDKSFIQAFRNDIDDSDDLDLLIVPLIIGFETETWMLADFDKLNEVLGGKLNRQTLSLPPNLESRANTKEVLKKAVRMANKGQTRGRGYTEKKFKKILAKELNLAKLADLPSYMAFKKDIIVALRTLNYLPPAN